LQKWTKTMKLNIFMLKNFYKRTDILVCLCSFSGTPRYVDLRASWKGPASCQRKSKTCTTTRLFKQLL
jgi:hypothetical protein